MLFSVIIPVSNKAPHLERSIRSVLTQTYTDFELILVDDASTDGSAEIMAGFDDCRIRILKRDVPGPGGYAARNLGVKNAKSKWIAFLDADDEWENGYLERMADAIVENLDIKIFSCGHYTSDVEYKRHNRYYKLNNYLGSHQFDFAKFLSDKPVWTGSVIIDRQTIINAGGFPEGKAKRGGDEYLWLQIMNKERKGFWVNYLGGTYHRDSVNMVTRNIKSELPSMILFTTIKSLIANEKDQKLIISLKKYWNYKAGFYFKDIAKRRSISLADLRYYFWQPEALKLNILIPIAYSFKNIFQNRN